MTSEDIITDKEETEFDIIKSSHQARLNRLKEWQAVSSFVDEQFREGLACGNLVTLAREKLMEANAAHTKAYSKLLDYKEADE